MRILHSDKDETPATEVQPEEFMGKIGESKATEIDLKTGAEIETPAEPKKKDNSAIWKIVVLVIVLIIAALVYYFKLKKEKDNG